MVCARGRPGRVQDPEFFIATRSFDEKGKESNAANLPSTSSRPREKCRVLQGAQVSVALFVFPEPGQPKHDGPIRTRL